MVLQAGAAQVVAERQQEIVVVVVVRGEEAASLGDQGLVGADLIGGSGQLIGPVGDDVQAAPGAAR